MMKQTHFPHNPELNRALLAVSDLMAARIKTKDGQLESALQKMATNGGKFLRPAFFWLFASLTGQPQPEQRDRLIKLATSIEVLHMATLIHDDIIDDSPERRGRISIQAEFGKDVAVYSGDYLFTIFFDLITTTTATTPFLTTNAQIMHRILSGELGQMADRFKQGQTFLSYLRNINGKTAALFSLAASEGAYFGGADQRTVALAKRIGQNVGIAFQILDDILDYSSGDQLNKPVLEDLATGVYSLPLLLAIQANPAAFKPLLDKGRLMSEADMQLVRQLVLENGGVEQARQLATAFTKKAEAEINQLPAGSSRRALTKLCQRLLKRSS